MPTYSFKDVNAAITGPGGTFNMANGAAASEEGITIVPVSDKNTMEIGADGRGQHSLIAGEASTVTVNLLKTSPINALLQQMYNYQTSSSVLHGRNTIVVSDLARGDLVTLRQVAFKRAPDINYKGVAGMNTWVFDAITTGRVLGIGSPEV